MAQLVTDVTNLHDQWQRTQIQIAIAIAFQGLISLIDEQREKVSKSASNEEESRYAQRKSIDLNIAAGFAKLATAYAAVSGDAFPIPPPTWRSESPSPGDLATPFGQLYSEVTSAVDPNDPSSVVSQMNDAAAAFGFPVFGR